jgi:hypothetical protein
MYACIIQKTSSIVIRGPESVIKNKKIKKCVTQEASSIVIRGPESVIPRGPNMEGTISEKVLLMVGQWSQVPATPHARFI